MTEKSDAQKPKDGDTQKPENTGFLNHETSETDKTDISEKKDPVASETQDADTSEKKNDEVKKPENTKRKKSRKKKKPITGKIKQINVWGVIALILFIITLGVVGYYGYLQLEISSKEKELAQKEKELIDLTVQYAEERNNIGIKKYNAARDIALSADRIDWKESTEYLIDIYDQLRSLDNENRTFQFESYQIGSSQVVIRGSVAGFTSAYAEGGLIDSISDFDFVRGFDLPGYNEADGEFTFTLTIDIFEYEG